jgi:hypothetical protein
MVKFTSWPLYLWVKTPGTPEYEGERVPFSVWTFRKRWKYVGTARNGTFYRPARVLVTVPTELSATIQIFFLQIRIAVTVFVALARKCAEVLMKLFCLYWL